MGIHLTDLDSLPEAIVAAAHLARRTAERAYNPYSGITIGAVAITRSSASYTGTFMENASFGSTVCAEQAALLAANASGDRDVSGVVVVGGDPRIAAKGSACTPCGNCRQFIWEVAQAQGRDIEVYALNLSLDQVLLCTISELLPYPWGR